MSRHPVKRLTTPAGDRAGIDVLMVPLIRALWNAGYETIGCCQNLGESAGSISERAAVIWKDYALLEMPVQDACELLDAVKGTPQFKGRMHWADEGAWEVAIPVHKFGYDGGAAEPGPWAQFHIPCDQIAGLAAVVGELGG